MNDRAQALLELRDELVERHAEIGRRVQAIEGDLRQTTRERSRDWDDRAQESENDEVLEQLDDQGRDELEQIDIALRRFEAGAYGVCIDCEEEIPIERLRARPAAVRCVACAQAKE